MIVKGNKRLDEYKYIVMFDLASKLTGVCVWDIDKKAPVWLEQIIVKSEKVDLQVAELYEKLEQFFNNCEPIKNAKNDEYFISFEAAPAQVRGGKGSTIQTFVSLARSHAVLDLYTYLKSIDVYDYTGIYPITTHAYLKKIIGAEKDYKITKEDIRDYVCPKYKIGSVSFDETDAVFLAQTLVESKWNSDIKELIREVKRHKKTLKAEHAIKQCDEEIQRLTCLLLNED